MSLSICVLAQFFAQLIGLQCQLSNGDSWQGYVCLCVCLCKSEGHFLCSASLIPRFSPHLNKKGGEEPSMDLHIVLWHDVITVIT